MSKIPILVVEDNETNLRLIQYLLEARGCEVRTATKAGEVFEVLHTFHPRLILMDLQLPGVDGYQLTRLLKANPAVTGVPIVALTAYAMKGDEEKALAAGCDGYITKPIDTRALWSTLEVHLAQAVSLKQSAGS